MASHLHDLIVAALESGCRKGELLSLQWSQVKDRDGVAHYIDLTADKTKTKEPRKVPITSRLRAILDFRRIGPDGEEHLMDAYVFGDEAGQRIKNVKTACARHAAVRVSMDSTFTTYATSSRRRCSTRACRFTR